VDHTSPSSTLVTQTLVIDTIAPTAIASIVALSGDSGTTGDFVTNVAAQTVSGTLSGALAAGETIQVSANGTSWVTATVSGSSWSASGLTLSAGTGTLAVRTIDTAGNVKAGMGHSYTLDQTAPAAVATVTALSAPTFHVTIGCATTGPSKFSSKHDRRVEATQREKNRGDNRPPGLMIIPAT
jgi:hypothetical protein